MIWIATNYLRLETLIVILLVYRELVTPMPGQLARAIVRH